MKIIYTLLLALLYTMVIAQPINDSPCIDNNNPTYFLGFSGSHTGTTCDAIGYNDNPNLDKKNVKCNISTDDDAVWYRAKYNPAFDGININITKGSIGSLSSVEVYVGDTNAICNNTAFFRKAKCNGLPVINMHIGCLDSNDYVFIKVASNSDSCGTFTITVNNINDCDIADACEDISSAQELNPVTPDKVEITYVCKGGCLDMACPDPGLPGGCTGFDTMPTVWFRVNTDDEASLLYTTVITNGSWTPVWSIFYSPNDDCTDLTNAAGYGSFDCSLDAEPPAPPLITGVTNGTYYIAVSAKAGDIIDIPNFELCAATIINYITCVNDVIFEVVQRENTDAEPDGPPYEGPFCSGEKITFHLWFEYDATQTGDDWLHGLIPKFGSGWDMTDFDFAGNPPTGSPRGAAEWYDENGDCAPLVMENFPFLCTYTDDEGHLKLCNTLYEDCPCSGGMVKYDTLPSGYFWVQEGTSTDCDSLNCSPSRKYGIGSPVSFVDWTINLKVKEFSTQEECLDNDDLLISFQAFSDGGTGCWDDPIAECLIDKPQFSPAWKVNCDMSPGILATSEQQAICSGSTVEIDVSQDDGLATEDIEITFEENPNVYGQANHYFYNGYGTINDILTINDDINCDSQIVKYFAKVITDYSICEEIIDTILIIVYPKPKTVKQDSIVQISTDDLPYVLYFEGECGYGDQYIYNWEDDLSGKTGIGDSILIDSSFELGLHTFRTTITDELGCIGTGDILVAILDANIIFINSQKADVSCFGECDGTIAILNVYNSTPPLTYNWSNGDTSALVNNLCAGNYFVTITDKNEKTVVDTIVINQPEEIKITVDAILDITSSSNGGIFITTNNHGNYSFSWTGPNNFTANTQNISNLEDAGCYTFAVTDTLTNCTRDTTICIENKTSLKDIDNQNSVYIVPNPNTGEFNLMLNGIASGKLQVELISNKGEKVYSKQYIKREEQKSLRFNFNSHPSGIYFLKLTNRDSSKTLRVMLFK